MKEHINLKKVITQGIIKIEVLSGLLREVNRFVKDWSWETPNPKETQSNLCL